MEENASEVPRCYSSCCCQAFIGSGCCGVWKKKITRIVQAPMVLPVVLVIFFPWFQWLIRDSKSNNQWAQKVPFNSWDFFLGSSSFIIYAQAILYVVLKVENWNITFFFLLRMLVVLFGEARALWAASVADLSFEISERLGGIKGPTGDSFCSPPKLIKH